MPPHGVLVVGELFVNEQAGPALADSLPAGHTAATLLSGPFRPRAPLEKDLFAGAPTLLSHYLPMG